MTLAEQLVALHRALDAAGLPHAFGGAIALAYWTLRPRGTSDIDVNVFVPATEAAVALAAFPGDVAQPPNVVGVVARDGQVRLFWGQTPIDLFFDYVDVHRAAARHARTVPFAGTVIPVLGPVELAVFKAMFDRTQDWADIEAMFAARTLDREAVATTLATMLEPGNARFGRLAEAERRAST